MSSSASLAAFAARPAAPVMTGRLLVAFTAAVGIIVLPLFASQLLVGPIGQAFGLSQAISGFITTATQIGYTAGLLLVAPLTDRLENRRLVLVTLASNVAALVGAALAPDAVTFLIAAFVLGMSMAAIQMLVPIAAALTPEAHRGQAVGTVMSGVMLGILLSRPFAGLIADHVGWRGFYGVSAGLVALLALSLAPFLPERRPDNPVAYPALIGSLGRLIADEPVLRRRVAYQALLMLGFNLFWTAISIRLSAAPFNLSPSAIALFALAGAGGAVISPLAGRAADRGWARPATLAAQATAIGALLLAGFAGSGLFGFDPMAHRGVALGLLVGSAILLDIGVVADQTIGRRAINLLQPAARGRINGLYSGLFFIGGASGAGLSGVAVSLAGWWGVIGGGVLAMAAALTLALLEAQPSQARTSSGEPKR